MMKRMRMPPVLPRSLLGAENSVLTGVRESYQVCKTF
jgi:hypothetical protein